LGGLDKKIIARSPQRQYKRVNKNPPASFEPAGGFCSLNIQIPDGLGVGLDEPLAGVHGVAHIVLA
jgi:hypothetical protein